MASAILDLYEENTIGDDTDVHSLSGAVDHNDTDIHDELVKWMITLITNTTGSSPRQPHNEQTPHSSYSITLIAYVLT
ncbi:predicted protein [Lichtheimia corymbifera JMRC:FSU:9682]|uniref:Uncharacterized protein n=1 Tax=Lichtheimia corymbifera JMRC:FSU:9682 TaxID=1263082 RepID=A0A068RJ25_9FUNG|nr:predicted protein [Lichtheimia corymbifera JMRC:FSU:9682]